MTGMEELTKVSAKMLESNRTVLHKGKTDSWRQPHSRG